MTLGGRDDRKLADGYLREEDGCLSGGPQSPPPGGWVLNCYFLLRDRVAGELQKSDSPPAPLPPPPPSSSSPCFLFANV